jgi:putative ABC transport system substrate-binding protein
MPGGRTNRRTFIAALGGAAAWPLLARGQQSAMPVIGFLGTASESAFAPTIISHRQGLRETGYVEGQNVTIQYLWAEGHLEKLPALAQELVRRPVAAILAPGGIPPALAAKAATTTIPIVFGNVGVDPVELGLVASIQRPGGNITGMSVLSSTLWSKRLELLRDLVPTSKLIAVLVNPENRSLADNTIKDTRSAANQLGLQIEVIRANTKQDIDDAFMKLIEMRAGALAVASDVVFSVERSTIISLAARNRIPAIYGWPEDAELGGLISYGANLPEMYRQAGIYTGRILHGEKPSELPVQQATRFELVLNNKTAKSLGLSIPTNILAIADEVIE